VVSVLRTLPRPLHALIFGRLFADPQDILITHPRGRNDQSLSIRLRCGCPEALAERIAKVGGRLSHGDVAGGVRISYSGDYGRHGITPLPRSRKRQPWQTAGPKE